MQHRGIIATREKVSTFGKRTLGSQSGASFALALLLFLVCVLLSSVIISASTAAVGRQAQLGEMEQRYYSVTSAAGLIEKLFANEEVKIECAKADGSGSGPTWALEIGDLKIEEDSSATHDLTQNEKKKLSLPELTALYYLQQKDAKDKIAFNTTWDNLDFSSYSEFQAAQFTLTTKIPTTASGVPANVNDKAKISITESFDSYGRLALTVSSAPSEDAGEADNAYALTLLFDIDGDTAGSTENVRTGTITWRPAGIGVGGSAEVTP